MQWDEVQAGSAATLQVSTSVEHRFGVKPLNAMEGYMLTLDRANLTAHRSSTWTDSNGLLWSTYDLAVDFSQPTNVGTTI